AQVGELDRHPEQRKTSREGVANATQQFRDGKSGALEVVLHDGGACARRAYTIHIGRLAAVGDRRARRAAPFFALSECFREPKGCSIFDRDRLDALRTGAKERYS